MQINFLSHFLMMSLLMEDMVWRSGRHTPKPASPPALARPTAS